MSSSTGRAPTPSSQYFLPGASVPPVRMGDLEGQTTSGQVVLKPLLVGKAMLMVEFFQPAGTQIPEHVHEDHESIVYLLEGRMQLWIGGETFIAEAGDSWIHPVGIPHSSLTLAACRAVEVKSPPRQTWKNA